MPLKTRKHRHKLDRLLSTLSAQDQAEFRVLCQFNPTYLFVQSWLRERGCEISLNGIFCWWQSNFPSAEESRMLKGIAMELGRDFDQPPYTPVLKLVAAAAKILCDCSTSKLGSVETHELMEKQLELFSGLRSLSVMSHLSKF